MSPEMEKIVEEAYQLFSQYERGNPMLVCHCQVCMSEETERELRATDLREITPVLLFEYNNSCHDRTEPQAQNEYRFLLPRLFELIVLGQAEDTYPDYEDSPLYRLKDAKWHKYWLPEEVDLVNRFFVALS